MKRKAYGITYARIYGLDSEMFYSHTCCTRMWEISFKGDASLPFDDILRVKLYKDPDFARDKLNYIKSKFASSHIQDEDKVAIIYDVLHGNIIAIGRNRYDCWIDVRNFKIQTFSRLRIRKHSFIPLFY